MDRLFRNDTLVLDTQHDALEDAVCGLAPRIFKVFLQRKLHVLSSIQDMLFSST